LLLFRGRRRNTSATEQENAVTDASIEASHKAKQPASRQSATLADHVYGRLVEDILSCRLKPGSKLRQKELSAAYGTAGSAVREALSQLASMGLVVSAPQRGFRVAETSVEDLIDLTVSRIWVESIALRSAIVRGGRAWEADVIAAAHMLGVEQPRRKVRGPRTPKLTDPVDDEWRVLHQRFHDALVSACGLTSLMAYRKKLLSLNDRYRRMSSVAPSNRDVAAEHEALTRAVLDRDADRAVELIDAHFLETAARVLAGSSSFKGNLSETVERLRMQVRAGDGRWSGQLNGSKADTRAGNGAASRSPRR
jgi:GntR family carbon starvation induced transcriptional regulator